MKNNEKYDKYDNLRQDMDTHDNTMELIIDSKSENESFARVVVASFVARLDPTLEEIADIKTAVSEAVTNCIIHGYEGKKGKIYIKCTLDGNTLTLLVNDEGVGIEDIHKAMEPMYTTKPQLERSGMGFSFMEAFMDKVEVESAPGEGTTVRMEKTIGKGRNLWTTQSL